MKTIVAVDQNWGIGNQGQLLARIPADMKYFKEKTMNKVVVMGQATFASLPGGEPLPDRINIVLCEDRHFSDKNIVICTSLQELWEVLQAYDLDSVFVIGGESVYRQLLPWCNEALVTKIESSYPADKYFPKLDELEEWELAEISETQYHKDTAFSFTKYCNKTVAIPDLPAALK